MLVGSQALILYYPSLDRKLIDTDFITTWDDFVSSSTYKNAQVKYPLSDSKWYLEEDGNIFEYEIAWPNSTSAELLQRYSTMKVATPEVCLALKLSHRYLRNSPHFTKTRNDILFLRERVVLDQWLTDWVKRREKETYHYQHPNLNRKKEEFFSDDGIGYVYDHDSIHEAVKTHYTPAYNLFKNEQKEVLCDMTLFDNLPLDIKLDAVWEESAVLALERAVIPNDTDPKRAFRIALQKVCTSITSGKFREFAWEQYDRILALNDKRDFVKMFQTGLANGTIKPFSSQPETV